MNGDYNNNNAPRDGRSVQFHREAISLFDYLYTKLRTNKTMTLRRHIADANCGGVPGNPRSADECRKCDSDENNIK